MFAYAVYADMNADVCLFVPLQSATIKIKDDHNNCVSQALTQTGKNMVKG